MKLTRYQRPELWNWPSLGQINTLRDEINRLFESPFDQSGSGAFNSWAPALDVYEDKSNLVVRAELPGLKKEEIEVSLRDNAITISGERRQEKKSEESETSRQERYYGRFTRSLVLPKQVDAAKVAAKYVDGVLTVTLPKAEEAKARQIEVRNN